MGKDNTGSRNTGNWNTGSRNTGNLNTGNLNTGDLNTGSRNTGNWNTGNWNTGDLNTGSRNTGNWNTGNWNTGNWNTGDLNTTEDKRLRLFNKDSNWEINDNNHNELRNIIYRYQQPLTEWISENYMSEEDKAKNESYKTIGGYLKVNKERYNNVEVTEEDRKFLLAVPNFDNEVLKECTGIDLEDQKVKIIIDGKDIWISKESALALKDSLCECK